MAGKTTAVKRAPGVKPEPLATTAEVAEFLGVPKHTLEQWRSRGDRGPRYRKVGRHVRYVWGDVQGWLDEQASGVA